MKAPDTDPLFSRETCADIQRFITSGFGRLPFSAYLVIEIHEARSGRRWLRRLLDDGITRARFRHASDGVRAQPVDHAVNIAFTHSGLEALGLPSAALDSFPPDFCEGVATPDRSRILGDTGESASAKWDLGGPLNPSIHAMLILHAPTKQAMDELCGKHRDIFRDIGPGVTEHEQCAQFGERPEHGKEPFGFRDGIAQPKILGIGGQGVASGEFILGHANEYGFHPLSPVVPSTDDPKGILPRSANPHHASDTFRDFGRNGSFVAYRKMRQDVVGFWQFLKNESARLNGSPDPRLVIRLAAKMVGRWPNGAPLILSPDRQDLGLADEDDFFYANDPHGIACPLGSHIRRTNPRDHLRPAAAAESLHLSARHRLLRRGRPYGPSFFKDPRVLDNLDDMDALRGILELENDGRDRGLHFLCVNASLKSQFEFGQQTWANNPRFNGLVNNRDPLIGDNDPSVDTPGTMRIPGCPVSMHTSALPRFVTVRGGAYLFMPSLTALRFLSATD